MSRRRYAIAAAVLFLVEAAIAVWVHDALIRPYLGDSLAVVLVYCGLRAASGWHWPTALAAALAIAVAIELGQVIGVLRLLGLDAVPLARVVLGTGYDPRDFAAYALGGLAVALVEWRR